MTAALFTDLRSEVEADCDGRVVRDRNRMCFFGGKMLQM
jgi:hypothetical protein